VICRIASLAVHSGGGRGRKAAACASGTRSTGRAPSLNPHTGGELPQQQSGPAVLLSSDHFTAESYRECGCTVSNCQGSL
jgi:hypothetical protein